MYRKSKFVNCERGRPLCRGVSQSPIGARQGGVYASTTEAPVAYWPPPDVTATGEHIGGGGTGKSSRSQCSIVGVKPEWKVISLRRW
jgi:hypothetical protein